MLAARDEQREENMVSIAAEFGEFRGEIAVGDILDLDPVSVEETEHEPDGALAQSLRILQLLPDVGGMVRVEN